MTQLAIPLFKVFVPEDAHAALASVLRSGRLASGPRVAAFETELAGWLGVPGAAAVSDASAALVLAFRLAGVQPGDEVIASPLACAATLMPIANLFARPVWCDIDPATGMLDPAGIESLLTEKTRAILVYHWSGDVAESESIAALAERHGIALIEDANAALGAECRGKRLGRIADFTAYSFYASKHMTTGGEGGALLTRNPAHLDAIRRLRRFGIDPATFRLPHGDLNPRSDVAAAGFNFPMNEIAATIGVEGLRHADWIVGRHRANGLFYETALKDVPGLHLLKRRPDCVSGYWTYSLRAERRDDLIRKLHSHGIGTQRLHMRHDRYSCFSDGVELPCVDLFDAENLSIPCGWWVSDEDRERIADCLRAGW